MKRYKFKVAVILSALLVLIMLFTHLFILVRTEHECVGEGCYICQTVDVAQESLGNLSQLDAAVVVAVATLFFGVCAVIVYIFEQVNLPTLVELKVKITN